MLKILFLAGFAYLFASIPFGLVISKLFYKKDIRELGSGNIGATNVYRALGRVPGIITLLLDGSKGLIPAIASLYLHDPIFSFLIVLWATVGHIFPIFIRFKGGKGVSTFFFGFLVLFPKVAMSILLVWIVVFAVSRMVSLASVSAALALPVLMFLFHGFAFAAMACIASFLVVYKHKENIVRILNKTEKKLKL